MRWDSPARKKPRDKTEWHDWFAWCPTRVPDDLLVPGQWVWLEPVQRRLNGLYFQWWEYREIPK